MHDDFSENVERGMPCFHSENEHFFRLEKNLVNFSQGFILLILMTVISYGPNQSQAQILLVHIVETSFNFIDDIDGFHDAITDFIEVSLNDGLE